MVEVSRQTISSIEITFYGF
ncbi:MULTISPECIES: hypothetical protein [Bacillus]